VTHPIPPSEDVALLEGLLQPDRLERMEAVLARRTRRLAVALEDAYDPHNVSAVVRSAEAFGVQDVHVIGGPSNPGEFRFSKKVTMGAARWLTRHTWEDARAFALSTHARGFRIAAADLGGRVALDDLDLSRPTVLVFGNEKVGISDAMRELADERFHIPMAGFVQSLNLSVAAAICLHHAWQDRVRRGAEGDLSPEEQRELRTRWIYEDVPSARAVLAELKRRAQRG
jgi:tRNA (guanosine-2'-O-)-methyltransferase